MKTISYKLKDLEEKKEKKVTLKLGYVGENEHVQIRIDCAEIWKDYPAAVASLAVEPPEGEKYPAIVTRDGDMVCWTVKDSDLVNDGYGRIQLTFTEGSEIQKTVICRTKVDESIVGSGTAPDPIADFVSEANEALAELEAAEVHGPVIGEDGYWYTWSKDAGEYVKTDTKAQGEDGQQGPAGKDGKDGKDGADGAPGQDGHTPVKGTDYWTQQDQADIVAAAALETVSAVIDDAAGDGDTNKTWSADKIADVTGQLLNVIQGLTDDVNELTTETDFIHNMLGKAGRFSPESSWYRVYGGASYSAADGVASVLCSIQYGGIRTLEEFTVPANHKIYAFGKLKGTGARLTFAQTKSAEYTGTDDFQFVSFVESWSTQKTVNLYVADASTSNFQTIYAKECGLIDLTATFGDVVPTKAQLDAFASQVGFFENFPVGTFLREFYTDYMKAGANGYPNLGNKTIVIMGDSISMQNQIDGNGNMTKTIINWPDYAMPLLGDPTVYNFAQDGSTYHDFNGSGTYQTFTKQYNLMVSKGINPDIIILAFGTNDYQHGHSDDYATAMGIYSLNGLDKSNNYQCIRWAYWTLTQNYPNALIIVGTPVARADVGIFNYVREAIIQMGQTYELNIVDCISQELDISNGSVKSEKMSRNFPMTAQAAPLNIRDFSAEKKEPVRDRHSDNRAPAKTVFTYLPLQT